MSIMRIRNKLRLYSRQLFRKDITTIRKIRDLIVKA